MKTTEARRLSARKSYLNNREKRLAAMRIYRATHSVDRVARNAYNVTWKKTTPAGRATAMLDSARWRGATTLERFDPWEIHQAARWRCHVCHQKMDPTLNGHCSLSARLDYIVPIDQGGGHTRANVKSAHQMCLARKRRAALKAAQRAA